MSNTTEQSPKTEMTTVEVTTDQPLKSELTEPIPTPGQPKQYRAIGLLWGKYVPEQAGEIERGTLITGDGTHIDAVVLGKLLGLVRSRYVDLEKEHLWVVYPRTRGMNEKSDESASSSDTNQEPESETENSEELPDASEFITQDERPLLHVQMCGIWEPETLHPDEPAPALEYKPDYFSIRGEVVYQNADEGWVVVKIIQFSRKKPDEKKPPYFNLKLMGFLPDRPVKNFWDLHVEREGTNLVIQDGERIAYLGKKKPKKVPPKKKPRRRGDAGQQPAQEVGPPKEPPKLKKKQPPQ